MLSQELELSLNSAFQSAREKRHEFITVEHLLAALLDNATASRVVMCSKTTLSPGNRSTRGESTRSMNTRSRSNTSTPGSVTSPCTSKGKPASRMASSVAYVRQPDPNLLSFMDTDIHVVDVGTGESRPLG